jgi:hypothetical protein
VGDHDDRAAAMLSEAVKRCERRPHGLVTPRVDGCRQMRHEGIDHEEPRLGRHHFSVELL